MHLSEGAALASPTPTVEASTLVGAPRCVATIVYNPNVPPFDDETFRRALARAADLSRLGEALSAEATPSPEDAPLLLEGLHVLPTVAYDSADAERLLAASRYADATSRPEIRLYTASGSAARLASLAATWVSYRWQQVGVTELTVFRRSPQGFKDAVDAGDFSAYLVVACDASDSGP